jgi:hypothetical protein
MKIRLKYLSILLIIFLLLFCTAVFTDSKYGLEFDTIELFNLTISFAIVSMGGLIVFFRGISKEPRARAMHSLTAMGIKFIAELFIALAWFAIAKKTEQSCIILFFVLYLAFSLYFIFVIINTLKNKSL